MKTLTAVFLAVVFWAAALVADPLHDIVDGINAARQQHHLSKLAYNAKLAAAAQSQTDWCASVQRMSHERNKPATFEEWKTCNHEPFNRMINAGYFKWEDLYSLEVRDGHQVLIAKPEMVKGHTGEILAHGPRGSPGRYNPRVIVNGWMQSKGHREIILTEGLKEIGVGFTDNGGDVYWGAVLGAQP